MTCDGRSIKAAGNDATIGRGHVSIPIQDISNPDYAYIAPRHPYGSRLVYPCLDGFHPGNVTYVCSQNLQDPNQVVEHVFKTQNTCKPITCIRPRTVGYDFSDIKEISVAVPTFQVAGVKCLPGYAHDEPRASPCTGPQYGQYKVDGCATVQCPKNSSGISVALGCECDAGFAGEVIPTMFPPFYKSTCTDVDECKGVVCGGASKCVDEENQYLCDCADGWKFNATNQPW